MKKVLLLLLALSLTLAFLTACQKNDAPPVDTSEEETKAEITTADILGFDKQNYNKEFKILLNNSIELYERDFKVDANASDVVSVATYDRNLACEEYLGLSLEYVPEGGNYNSGMPDRLYNLVMNGACEYDMVAMGMNTGIIGRYIDIYQNILKMDYIELTHPWWVQDMTNQISINGQLYFLTGDACVTTYAYIGCIFANLNVAENFNLDVDFYELVKSGNWTMEEFLRLFKLVGVDENNDGTYDPKIDTYGWANIGIGVRLIWSSCDISLVERQDNGTIAVRETLDDRVIKFVESIKTALDDPHSSYLVDNTASIAIAIDSFVSDRVLFASYMLSLAESLKVNNIESPFAILPLPKYDTQQKDYISTNMPAYNALSFPISIQSLDMSAQVAEFMGWYGQEYIIPAYYDQALKYRQNDVEANIEMIDLIREKLRVTPNEIYGVMSTSNASAPMYYTQTTPTNTAADTGFYSNPASVWKGAYASMSDTIKSYVLQYYD